MLNDADRQILMAARLLPESGRVFVGVGTPLLVSIFAKNHARSKLTLDVEAGALGIAPSCQVRTIGDAGIAKNCEHLMSMSDFFNYWIKRVKYDFAILKALEIDEEGRLNTFQARGPNGRLTFGGVGGGIVATINAQNIIVLASLKMRGLVKCLQHATNPIGAICKADGRSLYIVTENAVFRRQPKESDFRCTTIACDGLSEAEVFQQWKPHSLDDAAICEFTADETSSLERVQKLLCEGRSNGSPAL